MSEHGARQLRSADRDVGSCRQERSRVVFPAVTTFSPSQHHRERFGWAGREPSPHALPVSSNFLFLDLSIRAVVLNLRCGHVGALSGFPEVRQQRKFNAALRALNR